MSVSSSQSLRISTIFQSNTTSDSCTPLPTASLNCSQCLYLRPTPPVASMNESRSIKCKRQPHHAHLFKVSTAVQCIARLLARTPPCKAGKTFLGHIWTTAGRLRRHVGPCHISSPISSRAARSQTLRISSPSPSSLQPPWSNDRRNLDCLTSTLSYHS